MLQKLSSGIILFILILGLFNIIITNDICNANATNILYVGGTGIGNYTYIQEAIDNSSNNDTIFVFNGTYSENLIINKSINLIGFEKNSTIIHSNGSLYIILIKSSWVNLTGFTIQNGKVGIYILGVNYSFNNISNNVLTDNWEGIRLYGSSNNKIYRNILYGHSNQDIILYESGKNMLIENVFFNNKKAILLNRWSNYNIISKNNMTNNYFGISIDSSFNNFVYDNDIINCTRGIYLTFSKDNNITDNNFEHNKECGIYLSNADENVISPNSFSNNNQDVKQGSEPPKIKAPGFEIILVFFAILFILISKKLKI